jgi:2,3-bisphosphoglycerate-independent phosphoglycerate mutase
VCADSYYRGRGAFETMGAGLPMKPGDIAFKVLCCAHSLVVCVLVV